MEQFALDGKCMGANLVTSMLTNATPPTDRQRLQAAYSSHLPMLPQTDPVLRASLTYVLDSPGSLARPEVVFAVAKAYALTDQTATDLAIGLEYFHTASLLFDDLPCMDNATERRGAACTHLLHGEAQAILSALALINRAYALVWRACAVASTATQALALEYIESRLGMDGLLNGQSLDLRYGSLPQDRRTTEQIALGKTVSLIRLSLVLPALLGGAPAVQLRSLERIALYWGLAYQVLDDLKDVAQGKSAIGKDVGQDALLGRPNICLILGVAGALSRLTRLIHLGDRALGSILRANVSLGFLTALRSELMKELDGIEARSMSGVA